MLNFEFKKRARLALSPRLGIPQELWFPWEAQLVDLPAKSMPIQADTEVAGRACVCGGKCLHDPFSHISWATAKKTGFQKSDVFLLCLMAALNVVTEPRAWVKHRIREGLY